MPLIKILGFDVSPWVIISRTEPVTLLKRLDKIALEGAMSDPVPTFETSGLMVYLQLLLIVHSGLEFDY
jgi:hypothetical protein